MANCSHCGTHFIGNAGTDTCLICGYEQDPDYVREVRVKKAIHDLAGGDPKSYGTSKEYPIKKRWSMKD